MRKAVRKMNSVLRRATGILPFFSLRKHSQAYLALSRAWLGAILLHFDF